jgi:hypothetical protein
MQPLVGAIHGRGRHRKNISPVFGRPRKIDHGLATPADVWWRAFFRCHPDPAVAE